MKNKYFYNPDDWYYKHSWISSYFWRKLKRVIMSIVYKLYTSIEERLLEKYLVEFEFYTEPSKSLEKYNKKHNKNYLGDFKCYLPIIFMVKNYTELENLVVALSQSITEQGCSVVKIIPSNKIVTTQLLDSKKEAIITKFKAAKTGTINFQTMTPTPTENSLEWKYEPRTDKFNFTVSKCGSIDLVNSPEYNVVYTKTTEEK